MTAVESPARAWPTAAPGIALTTGEFEQIVAGLRRQIDALSSGEGATTVGAPPVIARETIERAGYVREFPNLLGTVHTYPGDEAAWLELRPHATPSGDWHREQRITDVVLTPAACYHIYPRLAGTRLAQAQRIAVESWCYRHEATGEPGRLRSFRMRELVHLGAPADCTAWRDQWRDRVENWLAGLGLDVRVEVATDPFFGPGARLLRARQRAQVLKLELTVPVADGLRQAVASANYHKEHFGEIFDISLESGEPAHSACTAFGMERIALALVHAGRA